jgi:hypothetical protein
MRKVAPANWLHDWLQLLHRQRSYLLRYLAAAHPEPYCGRHYPYEKKMHPDVTLDKIAYMMDRVGGHDEVTVDDMEELIVKTFVSSFELEHGFEADLIRALLAARYHIMVDETDEEEMPPLLDKTAAEKHYLQCQKEMYMQIGHNESYAEESSSWPDALPLQADWDADFLKTLARKEMAHHLVVMEQIREEMEKRKNVDANS